MAAVYDSGMANRRGLWTRQVGDEPGSGSAPTTAPTPTTPTTTTTPTPTPTPTPTSPPPPPPVPAGPPRSSGGTEAGWRRALWSPSKWPAVVLGVVVVVGLVVGNPRIWGIAVAGGLATALERRFPRHDQPSLRAGLRTDLIHYLVTPVLQVACLAVPIVVSWTLLQPLVSGASQTWLEAQPAWVVGICGYVIFSFGLYWQHRLAHTVPALWRLHAVHHSPSQLDWAAAARLHPAEFLWGGFLLAPPLIILGFPPVALGGFQALATIWAVVEHSNVRWRLAWMDRLYPNVDYHHWHHSLDVPAPGVNYGLPLWDTLFGTYHMPADRRPQRYGITEEMPESYLGQLAAPMRRARL